MYKERPYFFQQKNARVDEDFYNYNKKTQKTKTGSDSVVFRKTMFSLLIVATLFVAVFFLVSPVPGLKAIAPSIIKAFNSMHLNLGVAFSIIFPIFSLVLGLTVVSICKSKFAKIALSILTVVFVIDAFYLTINPNLGIPGFEHNITSPFILDIINLKLMLKTNETFSKILFFTNVANANKFILPQLLNVYLGCLFIFFLVAAIRKPRVDTSLLAFTLFVFFISMLPFAFKVFNNFAGKGSLKFLTQTLNFMQTYSAWFYLGVVVMLLATSITALAVRVKKQ